MTTPLQKFHLMKGTICFFFLLSVSLFSQKKQDYYWPEGFRTTATSSQIQGMAFDFNTLPMVPELRESLLGFNRTIASICNSEGELLFYSNGCQVANREHQFMENGDSLNFNSYITEWLEFCDGYIARQDILILSDPGNTLGYYLIHKPFEFSDWTNVRFWNEFILYSYIDLSENSGLGKVTIKNDTILNEDIQSSHLTAINHSNGKDWWIVQPGYDSTYYRILLDENGFSKIDSQAIGPIFLRDGLEKQSGNGKSKFSSDGNMYVHFDLFEGLHLYDFDRTTGLLSNGRYLPWEPLDDNNWAGSVEFSPNSRFIYIVDQDQLHQLDTHVQELRDGIVVIADRDTTIVSPFTNTFFDLMLAPDCNIYMRSGSSSYLMHTIHNPNGKGQACDFRQGDLQLPRTSSLGGFPNFPPFRVDEENKCDPSISMVDGLNMYWRRDLSFYPNPASEYITVELPEGKRGAVAIFNIQGQQVIGRLNVLGMTMVDVSDLAAGMYSVEFLPERNKEKVIYTSRLVVVD